MPVSKIMEEKVDKNNYLKNDPFDYKFTKSEKLIIYREGKQVIIINKKKAIALLKKLEKASGMEKQLILAKASGAFKFGNEKQAKNHDRNLG